jgi:hypothetical protein
MQTHVRRVAISKATTLFKIRCYKITYVTVILPVVLYGCETLSVTLREEHKLRVSENRVLRRIFEPKRDEVTRGLTKRHNEKPRDLYSSPSIIRIIKTRRVRLMRHIARLRRK